MPDTLFDLAPIPRHVPPGEHPPVARRTDPDTSHQAAQRTQATAPGHRAIALAELRAAGTRGLTDFELADRTGIAQTSIGKRRGELVAVGLVVPTDFRRPSPSGTPAIVWRAV